MAKSPHDSEKLVTMAHELEKLKAISVRQPWAEQIMTEFDEIADEWSSESDEISEDASDEVRERSKEYSSSDVSSMKREMDRLQAFHELAKSITKNSKGEVLLTALRKGLAASAEAQKRGANGASPFQQKAIIFTESRRTQEYLLRNLEETEFAGKMVLFNGTNSDPSSKVIYRTWLEQHKGTDRISGSPAADMRAALVERQLDLHIDHIRDNRTPEDILYELILKSGFPLTTPVEQQAIEGKTVYSIAGGALMICLDGELTLELIRAIAELKPERVAFLDDGFAGNDQLKANAVQTFKTKGIASFRTV